MGQQGTSYKKKEVHIQNTRSTKETKQKVNNNHCFGKNFRLKRLYSTRAIPAQFLTLLYVDDSIQNIFVPYMPKC